jgi:hypothetical protein
VRPQYSKRPKKRKNAIKKKRKEGFKDFLVPAGGVSILVDGMEEKDAGVSPSAIQEVKINQDPYSAEFARPGKGRIEIIAKQEARKYHAAFTFG